jgi:tripartite-type tricarboxylate transporter receptor subunit TctC
MHSHRRRAILMGGLATALMPALSVAQSSRRPIRFIVPSGPGGGADTFARLFAARMSESMGQPIVIENVPGAGGIVGADKVAKSAPDGHTVLWGINPIATMIPALKKLSYSPDELQPVTIVASNVYVWLASPDLAAKDMAQLISLAKAKPRQLAYASTGVGSAAHLGGALIEHQAGVEMLHVPFKNTGIAELMGGQVQLKMEPLGSAVPLIKAGRLRPLAVTSARRLAALPEVPAVAETLPGYEVAGWHGIWVPAGSPTAAVESLQKEFLKAVANSDIRKRLADVGAEPVGSSADEMKKRIARELAQWTKLIRERNIQAE